MKENYPEMKAWLLRYKDNNMQKAEFMKNSYYDPIKEPALRRAEGITGRRDSDKNKQEGKKCVK